MDKRTHHAAIPYSILAAVRGLDLPSDPESDIYEGERAVRKLGLSGTVAAQIERYRRLAKSDSLVEAGEVSALARLAARRKDAALVFDDAGRRLARFSLGTRARLAIAVSRAVPGSRGKRISRAVIAKLARRVLGVELENSATAADNVTALLPPSAALSPDLQPSVCTLYGVALAELLRAADHFDGAFEHFSCQGRGGDVCRWRTVTGPRSED